ncbi:MAG: sulfotransferase [Desulfobacteraceae bacterium]|nr:MAG: sulfotransferase [Desulfobacteraceae bacterium]
MRKFQPVIIIGAPRSGTNMLRDVLTKLPGIGTWPCDEINYIWRHGNVRYATDEFKPEMATPAVQRYISRAFERIASRFDLDIVVEKTCANSLRVPFVERAVPAAKFVFIHRDGIDAVGSAMKRWRAEVDVPYLMRKARYVPFMDIPYYAVRYFVSRLHRVFSQEKRLAFWGPIFNGLDEVLSKHSLDEICALQWQHCVDRADEAFERIEPDRVCRVSYETFVSRPVQELVRVAQFIGIKVGAADAQNLVKGVSTASVGKGRHELGPERVQCIVGLVGSTLRRHAYAS